MADDLSSVRTTSTLLMMKKFDVVDEDEDEEDENDDELGDFDSEDGLDFDEDFENGGGRWRFFKEVVDKDVVKAERKAAVKL